MPWEECLGGHPIFDVCELKQLQTLGPTPRLRKVLKVFFLRAQFFYQTQKKMDSVSSTNQMTLKVTLLNFLS